MVLPYEVVIVVFHLLSVRGCEELLHSKHHLGTAKERLPEADLAQAISEVFDFKPAAIIDRLGLRSPIYTATAAYGHFGRDAEVGVPDAGGPAVQFFPWELTDRIDDLRTALGS